MIKTALKSLSKNKSKNKSKSTSKKCSRGEIMRSGYKTKTGRIVPASCIVAQSNTGLKTSDKVAKFLSSREKMYTQARNKFKKEASKKCSKGYIMREGYKIGSHKSHSKKRSNKMVKEHWVKPTCIKSQTGKSKKGSKLIVLLEKNVLGKYGYKNIKELTKNERRNALTKAINNNKPLSIFRRVKALATLNKNKDLDLYKILNEDANWIKTQTEYIIKSKGSKKSSKKLSKSKI